MIYAEETTRTQARAPYETPLFEVYEYDDSVMYDFGGSAPDKPIHDPNDPRQLGGAKYSSFDIIEEDEYETFGPEKFTVWDE